MLQTPELPPALQGCADAETIENLLVMNQRDTYLRDRLEQAVISLELLACEYLERGLSSLHRETCAIADAFLARLQSFHKNPIRRRDASNDSPGELDLFNMPSSMALKFLASLETSGALHRYVATNIPDYIGSCGSVMVFKLAEDLRLLEPLGIVPDAEE